MQVGIQLPLKRFPNSNFPKYQNLAPTFPGIDNCLMKTKWDFVEIEASLWLIERSQNKVLLKVGCPPYAVGKQPSIPLIDLGRIWTLSWWWWWWIVIIIFWTWRCWNWRHSWIENRDWWGDVIRDFVVSRDAASLEVEGMEIASIVYHAVNFFLWYFFVRVLYY